MPSVPSSLVAAQRARCSKTYRPRSHRWKQMSDMGGGSFPEQLPPLGRTGQPPCKGLGPEHWPLQESSPVIASQSGLEPHGSMHGWHPKLQPRQALPVAPGQHAAHVWSTAGCQREPAWVGKAGILLCSTQTPHKGSGTARVPASQMHPKTCSAQGHLRGHPCQALMLSSKASLCP